MSFALPTGITGCRSYPRGVQAREAIGGAVSFRKPLKFTPAVFLKNLLKWHGSNPEGNLSVEVPGWGRIGMTNHIVQA